MVEVEFQYNENVIVIQSQINQKMFDICNKFINKCKMNNKELYYFYNGYGGRDFNKNLTFNQMANQFDKK